MNEDQKVVLLLFANGLTEILHKLTLNDVLVASQIVVAVATAIWIFRRAKGQKIDNQRKEQKLKK